MTVASLAIAARRVPPWTLALAAAAVIAFLVLAALVALRLTAAADRATTIAFQSVASYPLDLVVNAETVLGQVVVTLPLAAAIAVVAQRRLGGYAWVGPLLLLATGAVEVAFKTLVAHPGPGHEFVRALGNPLGIPRDLQPPFAFPSGHVARLAFLAVVLAWLSRSRAIRIGLAVAVAAIVYARVYIGDHWISDTLGGVALGVAVGAIAVAWMRAASTREASGAR